MHRLLNENELALFQEWIGRAAGTGTGQIPGDLTLLMGHIAAQSAELARARQREHALVDALDAALDYVEHGGSSELRDDIAARARAARAG
jgi:hypothetical protein